jgi:molybdopterin molybdotransferase
MLSVAEAETQILTTVAPLPAEVCPLADAQGRVLRQPLAADRDLPPFDRVTLDGYALHHRTWAAGVRRWRVVGVQAAGAEPLPVPADDSCIEVMTGAVLPDGADMIVPYEEAVRESEFVTLATGTKIEVGRGVHRRGSDHAPGSILVSPGVRLGGAEIAAAAACGYSHLMVTKQPKIAVVATGDELVEVDRPVGPHQIRRSNDYALRAALLAAGFPCVERYHVQDRPQEMKHLLWPLMAEYDVVVLSGGISRGKFDLLPRLLEDLGVRKLFQGVAQRPGKPLWFGVSARHTPVFALPGNPVSSFVCLHRYVLVALAKMSGRPAVAPQFAVLRDPVISKPELAWLLAVKTAPGPHGERQALPVRLNTSGDLAGLVGTDGFIELPAGQEEFAAGAVVRFWTWA